MRRWSSLSLVAGLLSAGPTAFAQTSPAVQAPATSTASLEPDRGIAMVEHRRARAQVEAIDYASRTVVLKSENGKRISLTVGPLARNFDKVKVGDQVTADYYDSTAIVLRGAADAAPATSVDTVQIAAPGEQPGGIVVSTRQILASVDTIDPQSRVITLTGPRGNSASFKVDEAVKNLDQIKKGDQLVVQYTEAFALDVDEAKPDADKVKDQDQNKDKDSN